MFSPRFAAKRNLDEVEGPREAVVKPEIPNDTRTPMQRFRTPPMKPLSVTDIISPAWCELQYLYNLTKYGRVRRTPAMKQGSSVHKELEEQVHTEVPVEVVTREDRFALRIWNIIQGLRTLMRTGMTRELEVWGILEGEVVNGIVDQITTTSPDEYAEAQMLEDMERARQKSEQNRANKGRKLKPAPSSDQRTLTEYLTSQSGSILENAAGHAFLGTLHEQPRTLYLVDVKTRQSQTLPPVGSQLRPTHYQLMLYHRLFCTLAANGVPADRIFARYGVDPDAPLSDTFIAQITKFDIGFDSTSNRNDPWDSNDDEDFVTELLNHNTLNSLWSLMITEFSRFVSVPSPSASIQTVSPFLTAEFRSAINGGLIGKRHFIFDGTALEAHVSDELKWWRGEREAKGVEIEEAFKCRICDFAEDCTWRKTKVEEGVHKARLRKEQREKCGVTAHPKLAIYGSRRNQPHNT